MTTHSPQRQHETARRTALIALARYGYLRASDLALLVYFDRLSGLRMAQRLLATLHAGAFVLRREGRASEENHYALSERGAMEATRLTGVRYSSGKDLLRSISAHRDGANRVSAIAQAAGYGVVTDREICCDPNRVFCDKVPDALIIEDSLDECGIARRGYVWVEVENSYRSSRDLERLARFVMTAFANEYHCTAYRDGWIDELHLVITDPVAVSVGVRLHRTLVSRCNEASAKRLMTCCVRVLSV